jgi:hypothetical protein
MAKRYSDALVILKAVKNLAAYQCYFFERVKLPSSCAQSKGAPFSYDELACHHFVTALEP